MEGKEVEVVGRLREVLRVGGRRQRRQVGQGVVGEEEREVGWVVSVEHSGTIRDASEFTLCLDEGGCWYSREKERGREEDV